MTLIRTGYPMYCAHFPGGDPRRFEPDPDGVTPAEQTAWEAACRAADEDGPAEQPSSAFYETRGDVGVMGHMTMYGPGTYFYEEDFMDEDGLAEEATAIEAGAVRSLRRLLEMSYLYAWGSEGNWRLLGEWRRLRDFASVGDFQWDGANFHWTDESALSAPPPEPAGPTARAEARADRHERPGAGGRAGRVEGVDR